MLPAWMPAAPVGYALAHSKYPGGGGGATFEVRALADGGPGARLVLPRTDDLGNGVLLPKVVVGLLADEHLSSVAMRSQYWPLLIQMPSPAEPRFCLTPRGWKAIVFLKPA